MVLALAIGTLLAGCGTDDPAPTGSPSNSGSVTATPTATAAPAPAPAPTAASVKIPTDCKAIMSTATYSSTFASIPLNDPIVMGGRPGGAVTPTTAPAGATTKQILDAGVQLRCLWRSPSADVTYLEVDIATVDPAIASAYQTSLAGTGYTCAAANGGQQCQLVRKNSQYPVDEAFTYLLRDKVFISVSQANIDTNNLMGEIVKSIWG